MKRISNFSGNFDYELLNKNQHDAELREKLAGLYSTPFADILLWELYDSSLVSHGYYKLFYYEQSVLQHIILFRYSTNVPKSIFVLNQQFIISLRDIENISQILFFEFDKVQQIVFVKIFEPHIKQSPKIVFEWTPINDIIILDIPRSMDAYLKSLGTSTRKKINLISNRIARDFPDFKILFFEKNNILYKQIEKVVSLNRIRMKTKGIISDLNDTECNILHKYASTSGFGFLCVCEIAGIVISATINSIVGEHAYMHVIAHDNSYNKYSLGQIALFHTTKYLIEEKNIKYYHLLCGTQDYKFRHGGVNHELYNVHVFRNRGIFYFFGKTMNAFRVMYRKFRRRVKENKIIYWVYIQLNKMQMQ